MKRRKGIVVPLVAILAAAAAGVVLGAGGMFAWKGNNIPKKVRLGEATYDVLVIGSGGAGMHAALAALRKDKNLKVGVMTKLPPTRSASTMAQGGMNGVTGVGTNVKDTPELHAKDTIKGGIYDLIGLDSCLPDIFSHKPRTVRLNQSTFFQYSQIFVDSRQDTGYSCLPRSGIACKHAVVRNWNRLQTILLTHFLHLNVVGQRSHLLFYGLKTHKRFKLLESITGKR